MLVRVQSPLPAQQEAIVAAAVDVGYTVHRELGPGFRERIYEDAYCLELDARSIAFEREKPIRVKYKQWEIPGQKLDLVVAGVVLIELKAVPRLRRIHRDQVISYLRTTGLRIGLLMNFTGSCSKQE